MATWGACFLTTVLLQGTPGLLGDTTRDRELCQKESAQKKKKKGDGGISKDTTISQHEQQLPTDLICGKKLTYNETTK